MKELPKLNMQNLFDKTEGGYYDTPIGLYDEHDGLFLEDDKAEDKIPTTWLETAREIATDLEKEIAIFLIGHLEDEQRITLLYDEEFMRKHGFFFFTSLHVYLYLVDLHGIDSNYMTMVQDDDRCLMIDLYCDGVEKFTKEFVIEHILQELKNFVNDIPIFLEEKFNEKKETHPEE